MIRTLGILNNPRYAKVSTHVLHSYKCGLRASLGPIPRTRLLSVKLTHQGRSLWEAQRYYASKSGATINKGLNPKESTEARSDSESPRRTEDPASTELPPVSWKDIFRLFGLINRDWRLLCFALGLLAISCSITMTIPKVIGLVLDATRDAISVETSQDNSENEETKDKRSPKSLNDIPPIIGDIKLPNFLMIVTGGLIIATVGSFARVSLLKILGERLVARLRSQVIRKTIHHDVEFFDRNKVGDLLSRLSSDAYVVSRSMTQNMSDGFKAVLSGTVSLGMMWHISPTLTGAILVFAPPFILGTLTYGRRIREISRQLQQASGNLTKVAEEQLNGIRTIKSSVAEGRELRRYNHAVRNLFGIGKREAFTSATFFGGTNLLGDISFLIVLAYGSHLVLQGGLSIGDLTAFMLYMEFTGGSIFAMSNFFSELMKGAGAASRLFELKDHQNSVCSSRGETFVPATGKVEFKDVSFTYPTGPRNQIFNKLNFTINPGSNVCIVGPSGRGKSTITALLLRFYNPTQGSILIDGQDISKVSSKSLRKHLGVVQQEPILMSGTIRENIAYALPYEPTMDEVRAVAKKCFCHNFITKFPDGYDTVIGSRGSLLSGGQRQRIAIARALIKKPKILVLDEATSALDVESEGAINYTLGKLMRSKELTIISIAHRLSTIRRSENVIVLGDNGSVVEAGRFEDLYRDEDSHLYKLLNEQRDDYSEDTSHLHDSNLDVCDDVVVDTIPAPAPLQKEAFQGRQ